MKIENINVYDLNEDDLKQIVSNITMKYTFDINTKVKQDIIKQDIQYKKEEMIKSTKS